MTNTRSSYLPVVLNPQDKPAGSIRAQPPTAPCWGCGRLVLYPKDPFGGSFGPGEPNF